MTVLFILAAVAVVVYVVVKAIQTEKVPSPGTIITALVAIGFFGAVGSSFTVVEPGNVGVVFNMWSGSLTAVPQGLVWRAPFVTSVQTYPVALRTYTMVKRAGEGSSGSDDSIDLPTKGGQHIKQDISVTYNTSEVKAADVFRSFRGSDIEDIEATFIRRTIITIAQNVGGSMDLTEVIASKRNELQNTIQDQLSVEFKKNGFTLDKVNMGASHLPEAIEAQMQQKMVAQQQAEQANYEFEKQSNLKKAKKAEAEGNADATRIEAQARADANDKLMHSLTPQLIEYKKVEKWNGALPQFSGGATPIINFKTTAEK